MQTLLLFIPSPLLFPLDSCSEAFFLIAVVSSPISLGLTEISSLVFTFLQSSIFLLAQWTSSYTQLPHDSSKASPNETGFLLKPAYPLILLCSLVAYSSSQPPGLEALSSLSTYPFSSPLLHSVTKPCWFYPNLSILSSPIYNGQEHASSPILLPALSLWKNHSIHLNAFFFFVY